MSHIAQNIHFISCLWCSKYSYHSVVGAYKIPLWYVRHHCQNIILFLCRYFSVNTSMAFFIRQGRPPKMCRRNVDFAQINRAAVTEATSTNVTSPFPYEHSNQSSYRNGKFPYFTGNVRIPFCVRMEYAGCVYRSF